MRSIVQEWMTKYPQSAILVVLEGHSAIGTGEIVYSPPGSSSDKHAHIGDVCISYFYYLFIYAKGNFVSSYFTQWAPRTTTLSFETTRKRDCSCCHVDTHFNSSQVGSRGCRLLKGMFTFHSIYKSHKTLVNILPGWSGSLRQSSHRLKLRCRYRVLWSSHSFVDPIIASRRPYTGLLIEKICWRTRVYSCLKEIPSARLPGLPFANLCCQIRTDLGDSSCQSARRARLTCSYGQVLMTTFATCDAVDASLLQTEFLDRHLWRHAICLIFVRINTSISLFLFAVACWWTRNRGPLSSLSVQSRRARCSLPPLPQYTILFCSRALKV